MCGIFGVVGARNNAAQLVLDGLKNLEYRGYDSWGIVVAGKEGLVRERHVGKIGGATTRLPSSTLGLGHTRWATHGGVSEGNAHPHFDCSEKLCLVHNGIVENFLELKQKLKGHKFLSETDTEAAVHWFEEKGLLAGFKQIVGMNAFIVLDSRRQKLLAVKNGSPLIIGLGEGINYIASDVWALLSHTSRVIFLEDNQAAEIDSGRVAVFDAKNGRKIKPKIVTLNWQQQLSRLGRFHHYMEKEIFDQPQVLANLAGQRLRLPEAAKVYFLGCGTASFAAAFAAGLYRLNGQEAEAIVGSEFAQSLKLFRQGDLLAVFSQSGETIDAIEAVDAAKTRGVKIVGVTNVLGSTLYRKSDQKILLGAGQEVAVASTKAFTAMLEVALLLNRKKIDNVAAAVSRLLSGPKRKQIKQLATRLKDSGHIFVVGRGLNCPIAQEAALKIKEVSYIHAEAYTAGELKHGPIALIERGMPCLVCGEAVNAAHEMKARGGLIIGINTRPDKVFDVYLPVPDLAEATAIPMIVWVQLLAYDLAISRGLNPDKPRNLAKSVTVK